MIVSDEQQVAIREIMRRAASSGSLPPLYLGVTDCTGEILVHCEGKCSRDSVFWICSQTKLVTSIAALQLVEQGKLKLDLPVSQILPELRTVVTPDGPEVQVTVGQLLNHTSGMQYTSTGPSYGAQIFQNYQEFLDKIKGSATSHVLKFEPGADFAYGYSTDVVGFIVEKVSGMSLEQYFKEEIFSPIGITSASFYLTPHLRSRLLPLHFREPDGKLVPFSNQTEIINQDPDTLKVHLGGVGLYASMQDYLALLRHLLQLQAGTGQNPILTPASVNALFEPTLMEQAAKSLANMVGAAEGSVQFSRALMINTVDTPNGRKSGTGSWAGYACTSHLIDPATGIAIVFGTQLLPSGDYDLEYETVWRQVEMEVYRGLK